MNTTQSTAPTLITCPHCGLLNVPIKQAKDLDPFNITFLVECPKCKPFKINKDDLPV